MAYSTNTVPVTSKVWTPIVTTQQNAILQNVTTVSEGIEIFVGANPPGANQRGIVLTGLTGSLGKTGQAAPGESSITLGNLGASKIYARAVRSTSELVAMEY